MTGRSVNLSRSIADTAVLRRILSGLVAVFVAASMAHGAAPNQRIPATVRAILFSTAEISSLTIHGKGSLRMNGSSVVSHDTVEVRAQGDCRVKMGETAYRGRTLDFFGDGSFSVGPKGLPEKKLVGRLSISCKADRIHALLTIPAEEWVAGVASAESPSTDPEVLKLHAILARTLIAKGARHGDADLCDSTHCALFNGIGGEKSRRAAVETKGVIIAWRKKPIQPFFCACCGGETVSVRSAFPTDRGPKTPYLAGVADVFENGDAACKDDPHFAWERSVPASQFLSVAGARTGCSVMRKGDEGPLRLLCGGKSDDISDVEKLRNAYGRRYGWQWILSSRFFIKPSGGDLILTGKGFGHRVGLCQRGANNRIERGWTVERVVRFYYPGADLMRVNEP